MGIGKAKQMIFTAKVITGQEAVDIGLVEELVAQNDDGNVFIHGITVVPLFRHIVV